MDIRGRCKRADEFRAVKSALEKAGYLVTCIPERNIIICQNTSEAHSIIGEHAPSGLTQTGTFI